MFHEYGVVFAVLLLLLTEVKELHCMCFTWTMRTDELLLVCTVSPLLYELAILDKNGKEQASCQTRWNCFSYVSHGHISHDIATNTTILAVPKSNIDNTFNGNWTCRHGKGKDQATAKINVKLGGYTNGNKKYSLWTILGLIPTLLLTNTFRITRSSGCCCKKSERQKAQGRQAQCRKQLAYWFALLIVMVLNSALPVYLDYFQKYVPFSAKYFIADGVILGIVCHAMSNLCGINTKTNLKESECDTSNKSRHVESNEHEPNSAENSDTANLLPKDKNPPDNNYASVIDDIIDSGNRV